MIGEPEQNRDAQPMSDGEKVTRFIGTLLQTAAWCVAFSLQMLIRYNKGRKFVDLKTFVGLWVVSLFFNAAMPGMMSEQGKRVLNAERYNALSTDPYGRAPGYRENPYAGMTQQDIALVKREFEMFSPAPLVWLCWAVTAACVIHKLRCIVRYFRGDGIIDDYNGDSFLTPLLGKHFQQMSMKRFFEPPAVFLLAIGVTLLTGNIPLFFYLVVASACLYWDADRIWHREYERAKIGGDQIVLAQWRADMMRDQMRRY
jgi:hypothetical protein